MKQEIQNLQQQIEALQAQAAATESLLQACIPLLKDDPRFLAALMAVHNSRMAGNLNSATSERFIAVYHAHITALTPDDLKHWLQ